WARKQNEQRDADRNGGSGPGEQAAQLRAPGSTPGEEQRHREDDRNETDRERSMPALQIRIPPQADGRRGRLRSIERVKACIDHELDDDPRGRAARTNPTSQPAPMTTVAGVGGGGGVPSQ